MAYTREEVISLSPAFVGNLAIMKRCPRCRRDYFDDTLSFCLDDGTALVYGPDTTGEGQVTAALPGAVVDRDRTVAFSDRAAAPSLDELAISRHTPTKSRTTAHVRKLWLLAATALAISAVAGFLSYRYWPADGGQQVESIAILPFENGTPDPSLEYLSDGISESLINNLSQLPNIKVIARTSSFKYKGKETDVQDIAKSLGVQAVLTGRVTQVGENLSISVDLTDARTRTQMWGEKYERKSADLLAVEAEISKEISRKLRLRLTADQTELLAKPDTASPEAYEFLLKGRFLWQKSGTDNRLKSVEYYKRAIEADPSFALAHAELSVRYTNLVADSILDPKEFNSQAEIELLKALALDETLADAHLAMANFKLNAWAWADAEKEYKRAIQLNPNFSEARRWYATYLGEMKRHDEAIEEINRARDIDPISMAANSDVGFTLFLARRYDEAIVSLKQTLELDPEYSNTYGYLGYTYLAKKMYPEAVKYLEQTLKFDPNGSSNQIYLAAAYAGSGDRGKARSILDRLQRSGQYMSPLELATLYIALGEQEQALASIEKAYATRDLQLQYLATDPSLDAIREEPRFKAVVKRLGLPE